MEHKGTFLYKKFTISPILSVNPTIKKYLNP